MAIAGRPKNIDKRQQSIYDRIHLLLIKAGHRKLRTPKAVIIEAGYDPYSVVVKPTMFNPLSIHEMQAIFSEFDYVVYSDLGLIVRESR